MKTMVLLGSIAVKCILMDFQRVSRLMLTFAARGLVRCHEKHDVAQNMGWNS